VDKQKFILWPERPQIKDNALHALEALDPDKTWDVVISRHVKSKTAEQRSWFHVLCGLFGDEVGMRLGDIKEIAKAKLFGWKRITYGGVTLTLADGHSENLTLDQYSQLIEVVYQLAAESGIALPPPDPYRRLG